MLFLRALAGRPCIRKRLLANPSKSPTNVISKVQGTTHDKSYHGRQVVFSGPKQSQLCFVVLKWANMSWFESISQMNLSDKTFKSTEKRLVSEPTVVNSNIVLCMYIDITFKWGENYKFPYFYWIAHIPMQQFANI